MYSYPYPRAALTTDAIVHTKEKESIYVLLIQRGKDPFKDSWALPGGFVELDETLEVSCKRELKEETGLVVETMHQFKTYDAINRDPRHRTISVVYSAELFAKEGVKGGDDAASAAWFPIDELPSLAFDHQLILKDYFEMQGLFIKLRNW